MLGTQGYVMYSIYVDVMLYMVRFPCVYIHIIYLIIIINQFPFRSFAL